jgi:hypothetical protein
MDYNSYYLNQATRPQSNVQLKKNNSAVKLGQMQKKIRAYEQVEAEEVEEKQEVNSEIKNNDETEIVKSTSIKRKAKPKSYVILKKRTKPDIFNN